MTGAEVAGSDPAPARRWLRNVGTSYGDLLLGGVLYILLTPILIRHLGLELYALWIVSHVVTFYLKLLDFGFLQAQVRFHARYAAKNRRRVVRRLVATTTLVLAIMGLAAAMLAALLALGPAQEWFRPSPGLERELRLVLLILAVNVLLTMPGSTLECIYEGAQRFDLRNVRSMVIRLLTAACQLLLLSRGYGIVALAAVELGAQTLRIGIDLLMANRLLPGLFRTDFRPSRRIWRSILPFALWAFMDDVIVEGSEHLDKLLVAVFLPVVMLTPYAMCTALAGVLMLAVHPVAETLFPMASGFHARGGDSALRRLLITGTKGAAALAMPAGCFLLLFGSPVIRFWVPDAWKALPTGLVQLVILDMFFVVYFWTGTVMLMAVNRIRFVALLTLLKLALAVTLMLFLVPRFGLNGFAAATLVATVLTGFVFLVPAACRTSGLAPRRFLGETLGRILVAAVPAVLAAALIYRFGPALHPLSLVAIGVLMGMLYLPSCYWLAMGKDERTGYIRQWHAIRHGIGSRGAPATDIRRTQS